MPEGRVSYTRTERWHVLRYFGRVDYTMAPALERFTDRLVPEGDAVPLLFDLRDATCLDSTNLGLMAHLRQRLRDDVEPPVIVSTNEDVTAVLGSMGFDDIFVITHYHPDLLNLDGNEELISGGPPAQGELLQTMLAAHRTLAGLNEKDRMEFEGVVAYLEAEAQGARR
jgi:anti-anti-sigma factor